MNEEFLCFVDNINGCLSNNEEIQKQCELKYNEFVDEDIERAIRYHITNISDNGNQFSKKISLIFLGRLIYTRKNEIMKISTSDLSFWIQDQLFLSLMNEKNEILLLSYISDIISSFFLIFTTFWDNLLTRIVQTFSCPNIRIYPYLVNCISYCVNNKSLSVEENEEIILETINQLMNRFPSNISIIASVFRLIYALSTPNTECYATIIAEFISNSNNEDNEVLLSDLCSYSQMNCRIIQSSPEEFYISVSNIVSNKSNTIKSRLYAMNVLEILYKRNSTFFLAYSKEIFMIYFNCMCEINIENEILNAYEIESDIASLAVEGIRQLSDIFGGNIDFYTYCHSMIDELISESTLKSVYLALKLLFSLYAGCFYFHFSFIEEKIDFFFDSMCSENPIICISSMDTLREIFIVLSQMSPLGFTFNTNGKLSKFLEIISSFENPRFLEKSLEMLYEFINAFPHVLEEDTLYELLFLLSELIQFDGTEVLSHTLCIIQSIIIYHKNLTNDFFNSVLPIINSIISNSHDTNVVFFNCLDVIAITIREYPRIFQESSIINYWELLKHLSFSDMNEDEINSFKNIIYSLSSKFQNISECYYDTILSSYIEVLNYEIVPDILPFSSDRQILEEYIVTPEISRNIIRCYKQRDFLLVKESLSILGILFKCFPSKSKENIIQYYEILIKWADVHINLELKVVYFETLCFLLKSITIYDSITTTCYNNIVFICSVLFTQYFQSLRLKEYNLFFDIISQGSKNHVFFSISIETIFLSTMNCVKKSILSLKEKKIINDSLDDFREVEHEYFSSQSILSRIIKVLYMYYPSKLDEYFLSGRSETGLSLNLYELLPISINPEIPSDQYSIYFPPITFQTWKYFLLYSQSPDMSMLDDFICFMCEISQNSYGYLKREIISASSKILCKFGGVRDYFNSLYKVFFQSLSYYIDQKWLQSHNIFAVIRVFTEYHDQYDLYELIPILNNLFTYISIKELQRTKPEKIEYIKKGFILIHSVGMITDKEMRNALKKLQSVLN